jgi:TRAP-type mannitol/chloroaromatic compound transport system substrate-binding protein
LFAPSGTQVVSFGANGQQQLTLAESGTYVAQVRASNLVASGQYNLGLECRKPINPIDATLVCGAAPLAGTIGAPAEVDQLAFSGTAGRTVTLTLAVTSGFSPHVPWATVFAPSGAVRANFGANGQANISVTETGSHVVQIRASNLVAAGGYSTGLQCP